MGLHTNSYWLTDRQSQCNFDFDLTKNYWEVVRPLLSSQRRLHLKTRKSLEKRNMIIGPDGARNQELLSWREAAAI
jgi:hypothetical protein